MRRRDRRDERSIDQAVKHAESRQLLRSALAAVGYWRRLEEIRSPRPSTGRHYAWLFAGWACVVAGLLVPPYVLA